MSEYWSSETDRMIVAARNYGIDVRVLNKRDGYKRWWEQASAFFAVLLFSASEVFRRGDGSAWSRAKDRFNNGYVTAFYSGGELRVYWMADRDFDKSNVWDHAVLSHELVHGVDAKRFGAFAFTMMYLFCLPAVLTMRAWFERRAYMEDIRVLMHANMREQAESRIKFVKAQFSGASYLFMDPIRGGGFGDPDKVLARVGEQSPLDEIGFIRKRPDASER